MPSLEEVLKKLNKDKRDADVIKVASDDDSLDLKFVSTGSVYLDYVLNNQPIPLGAMTLLTGWEGSSKSSNALVIAREVQKATGKTVVILDGERSVTDSHIKRFSVNKAESKLIVHKESALEAMLDTAEAFSQSEDVGAIIIDSIKSFYSVAVEAKSAEDNTIGIEAKKLNSRLPIILSNCGRRDIALIVINQWRENPGVMGGDPKVLPGGNWNKYMPFMHLDYTKKDLIKDEDKNVIGHKLHIRIKKAKQGAFDKKEVIELNFYY